MFENYREVSADEKAKIKAIHKAIRKETPSRTGNLAWAFVRGLPYRRVERKTRTQVMPDGGTLVHNLPSARLLTNLLARHIPEGAPALPVVEAWLADPHGAIAAPVPRPRKPFVREAVA